MGTKGRAPKLITVEPIGAVTPAQAPIPVVAMYRWAPPFGDESPHPREVVAVAWTTSQAQVRPSRAGVDAAVWLPARDVHRIHEHPNPEWVVARVPVRGGELAAVPGRALAHAGEPPAAVRVLLVPGTDDAEERWVPIDALVDEDPLDDLPG